ncbi:MAG: hypothetical protein HY736_26345 [Verrucomicrobia bacterium]|nr:hypothetical protein [Verrucomicrobiota bacterium]
MRGATAQGIPLRNLPLLFADDSGLERMVLIVRTVHPGRTLEKPTLVADQPWEYLRVYVATVHYNPAVRKFRMWYFARIRPSNAGGAGVESPDTKLLYATSDDGLRWDKPVLGLYAVGDSTANNVLEFEGGGGGEGNVMVDDEEADPARRYKLLLHNRRGYMAGYSADGIRWNEYSAKPVLAQGDTIKGTKNPSTGEYMAYHKRSAFVRGFPRRVVWLSRSRDFLTWSEPGLVFGADEADDEWSRGPEDRTEVYLMAVFPHAAGFIGFPSIFRHTPHIFKKEEVGATPTTGPMDIQLAASRDGKVWTRSWPRLAIIPRGAPGTFDGGSIYNTASEPVDVDGETWLYYTAINTGHGGPIPPKSVTIGRAQWRLHGFASLDAGPEGGSIETKPLRLGSPQLVVNADASRGRLQVALLEADGRPISGYSLNESDDFSSDSTRWIARWKGKADVITDRPVRVLFEMRSARLYSISCPVPSKR